MATVGCQLDLNPSTLPGGRHMPDFIAYLCIALVLMRVLYISCHAPPKISARWLTPRNLASISSVANASCAAPYPFRVPLASFCTAKSCINRSRFKPQILCTAAEFDANLNRASHREAALGVALCQHAEVRKNQKRI